MFFTTFHLCLELVVVSSCTNPIWIFVMDWMHRHINTHTQMSYGISIFGLFIQLVFDYLSACQNENYQKENTNDFQSCRQLCGVTPLKRRLRVISGWNRLVSWTQAVYRYSYLERFLSYGCHDGWGGRLVIFWLRFAGGDFSKDALQRGSNPLKWLGMKTKNLLTLFLSKLRFKKKIITGACLLICLFDSQRTDSPFNSQFSNDNFCNDHWRKECRQTTVYLPRWWFS